MFDRSFDQTNVRCLGVIITTGHLIEDLNSAKEKDFLIQLRAMKYDLEASCEASLLKKQEVSRPRPPVNENTKGEKDACLTSQTL